MLEFFCRVQYTNTLYEQISRHIITTWNMITLDSINAMWDKWAIILTPLATNGQVLILVRSILAPLIYKLAMFILYEWQRLPKAPNSSGKLLLGHSIRYLVYIFPGDKDCVTHVQPILLSVCWLSGCARDVRSASLCRALCNYPPCQEPWFLSILKLRTLRPSVDHLPFSPPLPNLLSTASYIIPHPVLFLMELLYPCCLLLLISLFIWESCTLAPVGTLIFLSQDTETPPSPGGLFLSPSPESLYLPKNTQCSPC